MGVCSTNRIVNIKYAINAQVREYERNKKAKEARSFSKNYVLTSVCSQCKHKMRKDIADAQLENHRENAPICMACIMGYTRTNPIQKAKENPFSYSDATLKKFVKYRQTHKKTYRATRVSF